MAGRSRLAALKSLATQRKVLLGVGALVLVGAGAGIGLGQTGGASSSTNKDLVILANVQRRTLQDTITLERDPGPEGNQQGHAGDPGAVSSIYTTTGATAHAGDKLFALDGRDAIAEPGTVSFFRPLGPGDRGDDVLQLKKILAAAGDNPGTMDTEFTQQTQNALAQWQAQHHYPSGTDGGPAVGDGGPHPGVGLQAGRLRAAAGLIIGPPPAQTTAAGTGTGTTGHP